MHWNCLSGAACVCVCMPEATAACSLGCTSSLAPSPKGYSSYMLSAALIQALLHISQKMAQSYVHMPHLVEP